jgi:hypothetical protein
VKIKTAEAIEFFESGAALARKLGIAPAAVYQWGDYVPESRAYQIHVLSGGALPKAEADRETAA